MNKIKQITIGCLLTTSLYATTGACWSQTDKAKQELAELDGNIIFSFKDSNNCKPIADAIVNLNGSDFKTNSLGEITLPIPPYTLDANLPLSAKKEKYITLNQEVMAQVGSFWQNKFLMTKDIPINSARFILTWKDKPKDLDLHLVSDDFHISYRNKNGASYKAKLDRDSTKGYGPETITLDLLDKTKEYKVYIYKYSKKGKIDHNVNFSLYKNNKLDRSIPITGDINSRCVQVVTIHNNQVKYDIKNVPESNCKKKK